MFLHVFWHAPRKWRRTVTSRNSPLLEKKGKERLRGQSRGWPVILDWSACKRREWSRAAVGYIDLSNSTALLRTKRTRWLAALVNTRDNVLLFSPVVMNFVIFSGLTLLHFFLEKIYSQKLYVRNIRDRRNVNIYTVHIHCMYTYTFM